MPQAALPGEPQAALPGEPPAPAQPSAPPAHEEPRAASPLESAPPLRWTAPPPLPQTTSARISRIPQRRTQSQPSPALDVGGARLNAAVALAAVPPWESAASQEAPAQSSVESRVTLVTEPSEQPSPSAEPQLQLPPVDSKPESAIVQVAFPAAISSPPRASVRTFTPARPISVGVRPSRTGRKRWLPLSGLAVAALLSIRACMLGNADPQQPPPRNATLDLGEPSFAAASVERAKPSPALVASTSVLENAREAAAPPPPTDTTNPADGTLPSKALAPAPRAPLTSRRAAKQPSASANAVHAEAVVPYDKATLAQALNAAVQKAEQCDLWGRVTGSAKLFVTFAPSGRVTDARLVGEPLESAAVARCILHQARAASLPPFEGPAFTVARKITLR